MHIEETLYIYENNYMSFLIKDDKILENIMKFGKEVSKKIYHIKNEFDIEPVYNEKYLKSNPKSYKGKINTNFHKNKTPKEDSKYLNILEVNFKSYKKN